MASARRSSGDDEGYSRGRCEATQRSELPRSSNLTTDTSVEFQSIETLNKQSQAFNEWLTIAMTRSTDLHTELLPIITIDRNPFEVFLPFGLGLPTTLGV